MRPTTQHPFSPDYAIAPGETLRARLAEIGLSQADLAARSGLSTKHVNQIIQGMAPVTQETALILERVTGTPANFWNRLEASYRELMLRARQQALTPKDQKWIASIPVAALRRQVHLPDDHDQGALFSALLAFFGVADRAAWERVWLRPVASFKRTQAFRSDPGAVAAWIRLGQLHARDSDAEPYNAAAFRRTLQHIRRLTREGDPNNLVDACARVGVAVVFIREIDRSRISGATWWASPTRAVIALSDRYKSADQFWFAFFHEAAHILLHSKKETFIDDGSEDNEIEQQAHRFAADILIPPEASRHLPNLTTTTEVIEFADSLGISADIVVGRLHHDGLWPWNKGNRLKRRLQIIDD